MRVKIVTDSTSDIPAILAEQLDITVVPLTVIFSEEESYKDGTTLTGDQFYQKVEELNVIPTTSQPTPFQFEEVYRSILTEDKDTVILSIHLSAKLSGTFQAAQIAKQSLEEEKIHVIDSRSGSYAAGMIVVELAKLAQEGKSLDVCLARLDELLQETSVYFIVDTLEYLQKNGRIGHASALLGSLLKIKPILSLSPEGEVFSYEKVRGQKKAISRLFAILEEKYGTVPVHAGIIHARNEQLAKEIEDSLKETFDVQSSVVTSIGAVIGAHVGPGTIAISMTKA
ncbi:DegV family protein [bacterium LRH843]|nr:DegV family protein [bacterium LRH843]